MYRNKIKEQEVGENIIILKKMYLAILKNETLAEKWKNIRLYLIKPFSSEVKIFTKFFHFVKYSDPEFARSFTPILCVSKSMSPRFYKKK